MGLISRVSSRTYRFGSDKARFVTMVRPNEEDPMNEKSDVYRTTVKEAVTGILNALHTDTPLDFNTIKAMHKDVPMGANFVNKVKQNDHTKDIFLTNYIIKIDEILQSLNMKLVPFYEPELVQRMDKRDPKNPQKIECTQQKVSSLFVTCTHTSLKILVFPSRMIWTRRAVMIFGFTAERKNAVISKS